MPRREQAVQRTRESVLRVTDAAPDAGPSSAKCRLKPPIRVLIAASDVMTGEFITKTLASSKASHFESKVLIGDSAAILHAFGAFDPQVMLLSDELEDGPQQGFKVLRELQRSRAGIPVVMLLKRPNPDWVISTFRAGACGIVYRSHSFKSLPKCLQTVHQGQIWVGNEDLKHILDWLSRVNSVFVTGPDGSALLTSREQDVVRLVADGLKNREIAETLNLSKNSVRNYMYRIFDKIGVSSRAELILYALSRRGVRLESEVLDEAEAPSRQYPAGD